MGNKGNSALLDFYLFSDLEDETAVNMYLEEERLDFDSFYENIGAFIKKKKAELKLAEGKKFKEEYLQRAKQILQQAAAGGFNIIEPGLAFRNLEELSEDDMMNILEDKKKLEILKKMLEDKGN